MKRRNLLTMLGTAAAGSTVVMGTSAFTSVSAERKVTVNTAADSAALLGLSDVDSSPNRKYVTGDGSNDELEIAISESNDSATLGSGVNENSVTRIHNLFKIINQGTQRIVVSAKKHGDYPGATTFAVNNNKSHPNLPFFGPDNATFAYLSENRRNQEISPGDSKYVSLEVDTTGIDPKPSEQILTGLTISADAVE